MVSSESRECIVSPTNELRAAVSIIDDMNNYNQPPPHRSFDFDDEPQMVKLDLEANRVGTSGRPRGGSGRRELQPLSENTLNMFACLVAATIATLAIIGLVITFFVLALK
uniref:Col_cuticle_N domain-containing protein n=1 Tax=Caenorhabditis tropicalis TaxID=1561998 RepID=A0A1I7TP61_9PELO